MITIGLEVAVALLAVLVVVFGLAGTVIPVSEPPLSSSSSDSVTHFMNPPTYNSSWLNITDKAGQYFNVTHNLNACMHFLRDIDRSTDYYNKITLGFTLPSVFKVPSGYGMED